MAPKKSAREPTTAAVPATTPAKTTAAPALAPITEPTTTPAAPLAAAIPSTTGSETWDKVFQNLYSHYVDETPHRTKLLDIFLAFLTAVGALQFFYCILAGNYVRSQYLLFYLGNVQVLILCCIAVQCLPLRFRGHCRPVRPNKYAEKKRSHLCNPSMPHDILTSP